MREEGVMDETHLYPTDQERNDPGGLPGEGVHMDGHIVHRHCDDVPVRDGG